VEKSVVFSLDDREWICEPDGPVRIPTVEVTPAMSPEAQTDWTQHNQTARKVLDAIREKSPLTLRELRGLIGKFRARNMRTGHCIVSRDGKEARVS
jgi:hypothetical protein